VKIEKEEEFEQGKRVNAEGGERVQVSREVFRKTWTLQFKYATQIRFKRAMMGMVILLVVALAYIIFFTRIPEQYFIFATGLLVLVGVREGIGIGSYFWDRLHHYGWIKENIDEETEKLVHFTMTDDGFNLYYEDYDIHYRWGAFTAYFESDGLLWLLDDKDELMWCACKEEIPQQWEGFKRGVLGNVEKGKPEQMKP